MTESAPSAQPNVAIRRLVPADGPVYRRLMLEAYEQHPEAFTSSLAERAAMPLSFWEARLAAGAEPKELVVGAFCDGSLAGAAGIEFETREKARHKATLFGMFVRPGFRGARVGHTLVEAALAAAGARPGVRIVQLTVTEGNDAARSLYERFGFVAFGVEPYAVAVRGEYVSKIHMWRDLAARE
jgi:ribosomal protein S18 acetylase RimI-like enzyme